MGKLPPTPSTPTPLSTSQVFLAGLDCAYYEAPEKDLYLWLKNIRYASFCTKNKVIQKMLHKWCLEVTNQRVMVLSRYAVQLGTDGNSWLGPHRVTLKIWPRWLVLMSKSSKTTISTVFSAKLAFWTNAPKRKSRPKIPGPGFTHLGNILPCRKECAKIAYLKPMHNKTHSKTKHHTQTTIFIAWSEHIKAALPQSAFFAHFYFFRNPRALIWM